MLQISESNRQVSQEDKGHTHCRTAAAVRLLRGFHMSVNGRPVALAPAGQRLIAFLALERRPVARLYIAGQLWPEVPEKRSLGNLRSALWRLRRHGLDLVQTGNTHVQLDVHVKIDVHEVVEVAKRLVQPTAECSESDLDTSRLEGELLPDWYDNWVILERERLRQLCLHALEAIANRLVKAGRLAEAVDAALTAIAADPFRESAHSILIQAYLAEGNQHQAVRQYTKYCDLLAEELNSVPSVKLQSLFDGVPRCSSA